MCIAQQRSRAHFVHIAIDPAAGCAAFEGEDLGQALGPYHRLHQRMRQQRLEFGGKEQRTAPLRVEQWLDPQVIACQQQRLLLHIPEPESKDTVETLQALLAPGRVGMEHHLGVRAGVKAMAQLPSSARISRKL
jgi:hypothetical protein